MDETWVPDDAWLGTETIRLLDGAALSLDPAGGFRWLGDKGRPEPGRPRPLWITARMTHVFSIGALLGRAADAARVDHGLAAMLGPFHDAEHGGWFPALADSGEPENTAKTAYEHAFVLLAASSARIAGRAGADRLLELATQTVLTRFWDENAGRLVEEWDRSWSRLDSYRGANANMHAVEAFLTAADATGDASWRERAGRIATSIIDGAARAQAWRIPEHYDQDWTPLPEHNRVRPADPFRPYGATPGHGLEWARLLLHLDAVSRLTGRTPEPWLAEAAERLFDRAVADGWRAGGDGGPPGFVYTTDWDGVPVVRQRYHWVACEAIATAAVLAEVTGRPVYRERYAEFWRSARDLFIAPAAGFGWVHEVDDVDPPAQRTWSGRPDWYHAVQATLIPRVPAAPSLPAALARADATDLLSALPH